MEETCRRSPEPKKSALDRIRAPDIAYSRADLPRVSAFSRLQGDTEKEEVKGGKIEYLATPNASTRNVFVEIEDKWMLPRPSRQKTPQGKRDMSKYCQYHKDQGHDTDDFRHLKIEIEKLIQMGQVKEYFHKETQNVNRRA
ncbi:hypothetical protein LIER_14993 [Lithospermum erythrorhizon]|uniref:Reverse transcriptase domain-containing protein n=1 Tax=Lithospermum erythrorhizon TaxID=34254 RepID=A0AAV3Q2P6_LITER